MMRDHATRLIEPNACVLYPNQRPVAPQQTYQQALLGFVRTHSARCTENLGKWLELESWLPPVSRVESQEQSGDPNYSGPALHVMVCISLLGVLGCNASDNANSMVAFSTRSIDDSCRPNEASEIRRHYLLLSTLEAGRPDSAYPGSLAQHL